jgi:uncharacterized protein
MYRLGCIGLIGPEVELIRTILRTSSTLRGSWKVVESGPIDILLTYNANRDFDAYEVNSSTRIIEILRRGENADNALLYKPFRADELINVLNSLGSRPTPKARHEAKAKQPAPKVDQTELSYKLKQWPPPSLLSNNKSFKLLSVYLSRHAISVKDLVKVSGFNHDTCLQFLNILESNRLLLRSNTQPAVAVPSGSSDSKKFKKKKTILSLLRERIRAISWSSGLQMQSYKILFSGTTGAGKTTAIGAISETAPIKTDVQNTDASVNKSLTTVGLDYGYIHLDNGDSVRLFGTPGQIRFDYMWRILAKDALGIIILIDNSRPEPLKDLDQYLKGFTEELSKIPCVIGVGRTETHTTPSVEAFIEYTSNMGLTLPVMPVDVREAEDVTLLVELLIAQAEADITI